MTKSEFHTLLMHASNLSFDFAKNYVTDDLPPDFTYTVILNTSTDDPGLTQFDIYSEDSNKEVKHITVHEVVDLLCRKNKVPVWIDISVASVYKNHTVFQLLCAGRYSDDIHEFYYQDGDTGPFGIKSPAWPPGYKNDGSKFSLKKKNSFLSGLKSLFHSIKH